MYKVSALKYRPQNFNEVVGQEHIVKVLANQIKYNKIAHAYLFCGPHGVGKTSIARIFAKAVNCQNKERAPCNSCEICNDITKGTSSDVIEIDGASNRGIEEIRELRSNVAYLPFYATYKVYIIDEFHMLTGEAFNAFLKTLEEPPKHVIFILATTQVNKILDTIQSRCQRYDFKRISIMEIVNQLKQIACDQSITTDEKGLFLIAEESKGSSRDALSIFDQIASYSNGNISQKDVVEALGLLDTTDLINLFKNLIEKNIATSLEELNKFYVHGNDILKLLIDLISLVRTCMRIKINAYKNDNDMYFNEKDLIVLKEIINQISFEELDFISQILLDTYAEMQRSEIQQILCEIAFLRITKRNEIKNIEELLVRLEQLKNNKALNFNKKQNNYENFIPKPIERPVSNTVKKILENFEGEIISVETKKN
jgi:DNA polymerase-3 subunit gamma/tau